MGPGSILSFFYCHLLLLASGDPVEAGDGNVQNEEHEALSFLQAEHALIKHRLCNVKWKNHGFYCYRYFDTPRTFYDAEEECQSYGQNVHLASITSPLGRIFFTDLLENAESEVWIGLRSVDRCNSWTWSDGTPYNKNQTSWDADQPDDCQILPVCVQLTHASKHYRWNDVGCGNKTGYVCETIAGDCS